MPWWASQAFFFANIFIFLALDWHARSIFSVCAYPRRYGHGKSGNRALRHYKSNWTFWQRMFWVFAFKEKYGARYRALAWFSYIHMAITLFMPFLSPFFMQAMYEEEAWYTWGVLTRELYFLFFAVRSEYTLWVGHSHNKDSRKNKRKH